MASELQVQELVHSLEEGKWKPWVQLASLVAAVAFVISLWFFRDAGFKGLGHPVAIDQAQISRELARGNGFTTKFIRPAALWQFQEKLGTFPVDHMPDTYHAPLHPWLNSLVLRGFKDKWQASTKMLIYPPDALIAGLSVFFFLASVVVSYFIARHLFDHRLAILGTGVLLMCQKLWDFALSGLPQMLMLFLFSIAGYLLLRAIEARQEGWKVMPWLVGVGLCFGLLALAHGLTIWMFVGVLVFCGLYFRPFGLHAAIMLALFLVCYSPWLVRNQRVCGSPVGLAWYSALSEIIGSESVIMRMRDVPASSITPRSYGEKIRRQVVDQLQDIVPSLGMVLLAPVFFLSLLHLFKNPATAVFRWCALSAWLFGVLGMAIFGFTEPSGLRANDLHVLFIPIMTFYGLAFVLVLWSRLELDYRLVRIAFVSLLFLLSTLPFLQTFKRLIGPAQLPWNWPPYCPPWISTLNLWTLEREIIASDMPWGVAWYADRKSLYLPLTFKAFTDLLDYDQLKGQVIGIYLTPISANSGFLYSIVKGEWSEWAPYITRKTESRDLPFKASTALPKDHDCIFYADRDRWTSRED
jgi:hypothetical protein